MSTEKSKWSIVWPEGMRRIETKGAALQARCEVQENVEEKMAVAKNEASLERARVDKPAVLAIATGSRLMICPHCGERGTVSTKQMKKKVGVSGGKATGALLTGGLSLLVVGLSRKELVTAAHCSNCGANWEF